MSEAVVSRGAEALERGGVVVFPTETVYGIGCRLDRPDAIARIFELKGRPRSQPLQVVLADHSDAARVARAGPGAEALMRAFMPGPLTLVLPALPGLPDLGEAAGTVGVRVPDHPVALALLRAAGPMAATSANLSGRPAARALEEVRRLFGDAVDAYVDGPPAPAGTASTVVRLVDGSPEVLREGAIDRRAIREALPRVEGPAMDRAGP